MEKRPRGQIRMHERRDGQVTYSLRVRAYGRREILTLGTDTEGWTHRKAERMLDRVLAEIEVGVWRPPRSRRSATPTRPSMCSPPAGGRRARPSFARQRKRTTSGAYANTCCPSSPTSVCRTSPSRSSTSTATRRSSSANGSGPSLRRGCRYETSADSAASRSATSRSTRPSCSWRTSSTPPSSTSCFEQPGARQAAAAQSRASPPAARGRRTQRGAAGPAADRHAPVSGSAGAR